MAVIKEEFYEGVTFDTLPELETRCQTDEKQHTAKMTKLVLAKDDGKDGTLGTYERVPLSQMKLGLIFREYKTEAEANIIEKELEQKKNTKMFRTIVLIGAEKKKITIFRKK